MRSSRAVHLAMAVTAMEVTDTEVTDTMVGATATIPTAAPMADLMVVPMVAMAATELTLVVLLIAQHLLP